MEKQIGMIDDNDECEWVNVFSGTGSPGLSWTKSKDRKMVVCVCVIKEPCVHCVDWRLASGVWLTGASSLYYHQPPPEAPVPAVPSRREKKRLDIIDPRTGANVISDLHDSSSPEFKPLRNEVYMFDICCSIIYFEYLITLL